VTRGLLAAASLVAACASTTTQPGGSFSADIFEDIPAPKTAVYHETGAQSFSYATQTHRCGRFQYDYLGSQSEAVAFFKDTMTAPPYSWTLVSEETPAEGSALLVFTKGGDRCTVDIDRHEPRHGSDAENVRILVRVNFLR
jgi:hypothetical protein